MGYIESLTRTVDIDRLCIHEAGHAVLSAIVFHRPFKYVTIEENEKYLGHVSGIKEVMDWTDAIITAGGVYAEAILCGKTISLNEGGSGDFAHIDKIIDKLYEPYLSSWAHNELMKETDLLLRQNWKAVCSVAKALKENKTLTFEQVKQLQNKTNNMNSYQELITFIDKTIEDIKPAQPKGNKKEVASEIIRMAADGLAGPPQYMDAKIAEIQKYARQQLHKF